MKKIIYVLIFIISTFILSNTINAWNEYTVGQEVEYNGIKYYVIKNSGKADNSVTMLKKDPLSYDDIQIYSDGTGASISNQNGYGGIQYHTDSNVYATSFIKSTLSSWSEANIPSGLVEARLLKYEELEFNLGYDHGTPEQSWINVNPEYTPSWVYNGDYCYWTMSLSQDSTIIVWGVNTNGNLIDAYINYSRCVVRPVVVLSKSVLVDTGDGESDNENVIPDIEETTTKVKVTNTYFKTSIVIIILGFISAGVGIFIYYKICNKKK